VRDRDTFNAEPWLPAAMRLSGSDHGSEPPGRRAARRAAKRRRDGLL